MGNIVYSIIWFLILIFIGFWVAGVCAGLYILIHPLSVCISALTGISDLLLKGIQFPHYCAQKMMDGSPIS